MTSMEVFVSHALREFKFLIDDYDFVLESTKGPNEWGELRHRYARGTWLVSPLYNKYDRSINVEFGRTDQKDSDFSFHIYLSLVDSKRYYELGHAIANEDCDIGPIVHFYAESLKASGEAILIGNSNVCEQMKRAMRFGEGMCPSYGEQPKGSRIKSRFE